MDLPTYMAGNIQAKAHRQLREHVYEVLDKYELTPTYWSMLGIITHARDGVRQTEIARDLHVKAPLVTLMARKLQDKGFVTSVKNQFDARAKLLAITPEGKKYIKTVESALNKSLSQLLKGLTEDDLATYHKVLVTIINNSESPRRR
ncbi:MAG TPA: MarR family transcriptional regulator [Candidatus Saccharimonadales bacterium]|nr:MarR family transcriptional regulator [Candidatus Saccharimonadales bacterium]